jgi:predicted HTH domain antitoxin
VADLLSVTFGWQIALGKILYTHIIYLCFIPMRKPMKTVNVSGLKNNPSEALRMAHDDLVLVMNRNEPDTLMIGLKSSNIIDLPGVRKALATALFRDGELSIARSAKLADMPLADFIAHVSRLGIPIINQTADEAKQDMDTLDQWLKQA